MANGNKDLQESLKNLHQELSNASDINPATTDSLRAVIAEIQSILEKPTQDTDDGSATAATDPESAKHHSNLNDAALEFQTSHPVLSRALTQLVDSLGQIFQRFL